MIREEAWYIQNEILTQDLDLELGVDEQEELMLPMEEDPNRLSTSLN